MPNAILGLGLSPRLVTRLTHPSCHWHLANNLGEAFNLLQSIEFLSVIVQGSASAGHQDCLRDLLGRTPLTTRIVFFCEDLSLADDTELAELGVMWVKTVRELEDLITAL
jgi:hypothetical protein